MTKKKDALSGIWAGRLEGIEAIWQVSGEPRRVEPAERVGYELGKATGLARVTAKATEASGRKAWDAAVHESFDEVVELSREIERRCFELARSDGHGETYSGTAAETLIAGLRSMEGYLPVDAPAVDRFDYIAMVQAESLGHWSILTRLDEPYGTPECRRLSEWATESIRVQMSQVVRNSLALLRSRARVES